MTENEKARFVEYKGRGRDLATGAFLWKCLVLSIVQGL